MGGTTTGYMSARSRHRRIHWRYPRPKVYGFMPRMCFAEMRPRRRQQILEHTLLGSEIASHMSHISHMSHVFLSRLKYSKVERSRGAYDIEIHGTVVMLVCG